MNTESIATKRVDRGKVEKPGDFCFDEDFSHIYIILPGVQHPDAIPIQKGSSGTPRVWGWDGNEESPTLTPSISLKSQWHGYLRAGRLESC